MADYSYAQLSQMQNEAIARVREMRKKANQAAEAAAREFSDNRKSNDPQNGNRAECPNNEKADGVQENAKGNPACPHCHNVRQKGSCPKKCRNEGNPILKLLSDNGLRADEPDSALILALCFLLYAEKTDTELIPALLYLLT